MEEGASIKEQRIRKITHLYYSQPEIQEAMFEFSKNREICPRYFEGFGKRPDTFQYKGDMFELVKKGATSFHCSEELWEDPLKVSTGMTEKQLNELRTGWDLLIDIDSKYIDYSKISAQLLIKALEFHGIKNMGIKFSGSKGFHIIIPWKAFPKKVNTIKTSDMFPEWPRIIIQYLNERIKEQLVEKISDLERPNKYIKDFTISEQVMPDLVLVSSRHLFRAPYSLHEKTALASVVLSSEEIEDFDLKKADPLKVRVRNFTPNSLQNEAQELLMQALDWHKENFSESKAESKRDFKIVKITNLSDSSFPPSIQKILRGVKDGRKRALFILINLFRSIGVEKDEIEKKIYEWNNKNEVPLHEGYIKAQLSWGFRNKITPPPNYDKDYYKGIGVVPNEEELRYKNPVNYMAKKFGKSNTDSK
jgi:DNA primase catalytic subunit